MADDCIRCADQPATDSLGYCSYCHWSTKAEVAHGLYELGKYLAHWREFADYLDAHGLARPEPGVA